MLLFVVIVVVIVVVAAAIRTRFPFHAFTGFCFGPFWHLLVLLDPLGPLLDTLGPLLDPLRLHFEPLRCNFGVFFMIFSVSGP